MENDDKKLEIVISNVLRAGVALAAFFVLSGGIFYLISHSAMQPDYHKFKTTAVATLNLHGMLSNMLALNSIGVIQFGLLLLIATPILRVVLSVFAFIAERDRLYAIITLVVLAILLFSIFRI